eukprot:scaffold1424_cov237-Pinguiococcus_pyrenoidosus.AAC.15
MPGGPCGSSACAGATRRPSAATACAPCQVRTSAEHVCRPDAQLRLSPAALADPPGNTSQGVGNATQLALEQVLAAGWDAGAAAAAVEQCDGNATAALIVLEAEEATIQSEFEKGVESMCTNGWDADVARQALYHQYVLDQKRARGEPLPQQGEMPNSVAQMRPTLRAQPVLPKEKPKAPKAKKPKAKKAKKAKKLAETPAEKVRFPPFPRFPPSPRFSLPFPVFPTSTSPRSPRPPSTLMFPCSSIILLPHLSLSAPAAADADGQERRRGVRAHERGPAAAADLRLHRPGLRAGGRVRRLVRPVQAAHARAGGGGHEAGRLHARGEDQQRQVPAAQPRLRRVRPAVRVSLH